MIDIVELPAQATLEIRQRVLWPERPREFCMLDEDACGTHFGARIDGALVGVVSAFRGDGVLGFRKFAVLPAYRRLGVGRSLIEAVKACARARGLRSVQCDARESACGFYERCGFAATGAAFLKYGAPYQRMTYLIG